MKNLLKLPLLAVSIFVFAQSESTNSGSSKEQKVFLPNYSANGVSCPGGSRMIELYNGKIGCITVY